MRAGSESVTVTAPFTHTQPSLLLPLTASLSQACEHSEQPSLSFVCLACDCLSLSPSSELCCVQVMVMFL